MVAKSKKRSNDQLYKLDSFTRGYLLEEPPVFSGFIEIPGNGDGFFIENLRDGSIFKWIDIKMLLCNGIYYKQKRHSRGGRRNFSGKIFPDDLKNEYYETDDTRFKKCIKNFGGFYISISRAKRNEQGLLNYSAGKLINMISLPAAEELAQNYAHYAGNNEFVSCLPCGAAMDCMFEDVFERFRIEVSFIRKDGESEYEAWNRHENEIRSQLLEKGVYGMYDLFSSGREYTSEFFKNSCMVAVRCGRSHGLYLIDYSKNPDVESADFVAASRNFTSHFQEDGYLDLGYRIVLLPIPKESN